MSSVVAGPKPKRFLKLRIKARKEHKTEEPFWITLRRIERAEARAWKARDSTSAVRWTARLFTAGVVVVVISVALALANHFVFKDVDAGEWAPVVVLGLGYALMAISQIVSVFVFWKKLRSPFRTILDNAVMIDRIDQRSLRMLSKHDDTELRRAKHALILESNGLHHRLGVVVGPFEKLGLLPGLVSYAFLVQKVRDSTEDGTTVKAAATEAGKTVPAALNALVPFSTFIEIIAWACAILFVIAFGLLHVKRKLDKYSSLIDKVIEERAAPQTSPKPTSHQRRRESLPYASFLS